jgi:hypothetical protein
MVHTCTFARCWKYTARYPSHDLENMYFRLSLRSRTAEIHVFQNMTKTSCSKSGRQPKQWSVLFLYMIFCALTFARFGQNSIQAHRGWRPVLSHAVSLDSYKGVRTARKSASCRCTLPGGADTCWLNIIKGSEDWGYVYEEGKEGGPWGRWHLGLYIVLLWIPSSIADGFSLAGLEAFADARQRHLMSGRPPKIRR